MKVCIIGAGVSGLSCAARLEKYGIIPDIYEQYDRCGGRVPYALNLFGLMNRPVKDPLNEMVKQYGIKIKPIGVLDKFVTFSPRNMYASRGPLGYAFEIGPSARSLNSQLCAQVSAGIKYKARVDFKEMARVYDRVVVATGTPYAAKELGCWTDIFRGWITGAVVEGEFSPSTWICWFDKSYANNGYAYLGAFNSREATLGLTISDIRENEIEAGWKKFLDTEKIEYRQKDMFYQEHIAGFCHRREVGNILLVGNAGGFLDSLLGLGLYNAVVSGVLAADAIYEGSSYEKKIGFLKKKIYHSFVARRQVSKLKNSGYDYLFGILGNTAVNRLVFNTGLNVLAINAMISHPASHPALH